MIRKSFLFLDGIGQKLDEKIRKQVFDWQGFLATEKITGISKKRKLFYDRELQKASNAIFEDESNFFVGKLKQSEHWVLYDYFKDNAVYLDIEVSGHSENSFITVIGLYDGYDTKIMIKDVNLNFQLLKKELSNYKFIISFNGTCFDAPYMKKRCNVLPNVPHMDLRFLCNRIGLTGGLKEIEKKIGIKRSKLVSRIKGGDPYLLWRMYRGSGDKHYLNLLVEYNEEDVMSLKKLAEIVYSKLSKTFVLN